MYFYISDMYILQVNSSLYYDVKVYKKANYLFILDFISTHIYLAVAIIIGR